MDARTNNSESGRSLTEMLGVLAVMGVLTIGAIAGFNYAMNKQRANATVNYVNQLAIEGSRQMLAGSNHLSLLDYPDKTPSGYGVELGLLSDTNAYFEVYVKEVPQAVCDQIQTMAEGWRGLDTLWINEDGKKCDKELNTMSFIFTDTLSRGTSGTRCTDNSGCDGCQTCQRGFCTDTNSACPADTPNCVSGTCETCPAGEFRDQRGKCHKCTGNTVTYVDPEECQKCLGKMYYYGGTWSRCASCSDPSVYHYVADKTSCLACPNRYFYQANEIEGLGTCPYCNGKVVTDEKGESVCQGNCPDGEVWTREGCKACDDPAGWFYNVHRQSCRTRCAGIRFPNSGEQCVRCDVLNHSIAPKADCELCPNRYEHSNGWLCLYCPTELVIDANGNRTCPHDPCPEGEVWSTAGCQPCDTTDTLYDADYNDCLRCGNRVFKSDLTCRLCTGTVSGNTCITE